MAVAWNCSEKLNIEHCNICHEIFVSETGQNNYEIRFYHNGHNFQTLFGENAIIILVSIVCFAYLCNDNWSHFDIQKILLNFTEYVMANLTCNGSYKCVICSYFLSSGVTSACNSSIISVRFPCGTDYMCSFGKIMCLMRTHCNHWLSLLMLSHLQTC